MSVFKKRATATASRGLGFLLKYNFIRLISGILNPVDEWHFSLSTARQKILGLFVVDCLWCALCWLEDVWNNIAP
jgi:hypothetical protein